MSWHTLAIALTVALFLFDFQNLLAWWRGRTLPRHERGSNDFTIVVPVYGHPRYFENRDSLRCYRRNCLIVLEVSEPGMARFAAELDSEGWRVLAITCDNPSPPKLIEAALPHVTTTLMIRMDADTRPAEDLSRHAASMLRDGADLCSVKVGVANPRTQAERMQALEYRMAMLSRHFRPWLTSGACIFARTVALRKIFAQHSMWFPGEDIETGRIAFALRMRIRHLDFLVETDAPATWRGLFRQRRLWWAGSFRHTIVNVDRNLLQLPVWTFYYLALVWVGVYFKWQTIAAYFHPFILLQALGALFAVYAVITVVANVRVFSWRMLVYPPYALLQAMLMPTVGSIYYVVCARRQGFLGRYRFGYRRARRISVRGSFAEEPWQYFYQRG